MCFMFIFIALFVKHYLFRSSIDRYEAFSQTENVHNIFLLAHATTGPTLRNEGQTAGV